MSRGKPLIIIFTSVAATTVLCTPSIKAQFDGAPLQKCIYSLHLCSLNMCDTQKVHFVLQNVFYLHCTVHNTFNAQCFQCYIFVGVYNIFFENNVAFFCKVETSILYLYLYLHFVLYRLQLNVCCHVTISKAWDR